MFHFLFLLKIFRLELDLLITTSGIENSSEGEIIFIQLKSVDAKNQKVKVTSIKNGYEKEVFILGNN